MKGKRIFVVDDDPGILRLLATNLESRGYETVTFNSGLVALERLESFPPDLMLLDILLPGVDGIDLVRRIRETSGVPIIMISGKDEVATKLEALDLGADDYLTKPFSIEELLARVRAALRRSNGTVPSEIEGSYHCGYLDVDLGRSEVALKGTLVKLSSREWAVLRTFIRYVGKVVTHRMLLQQVWGPEYGNEGDYIRTYVARLRRKLEPLPHSPQYLLTERGIGYRLVNPNGPYYNTGTPSRV